MKSSITKRQKDLLDIIYKYIKDTGYPPSFEEMRESLEVSSNQSIVDHLKELEEKRIIKRNKGMARSIAILPLGYKILNRPSLVAFLGVTSAGAPIEAIEISGDWQTVSPEVTQLKDKIFLLKISGDSMINAGIDDGDLVLVKSQKEFLSGDIVLAQIGDDSTVKRFMRKKGRGLSYLKPENPEYDAIACTKETEIKGKIISVLKNDYWKPVK